jgi:hypothetical protein
VTRPSVSGPALGCLVAGILWSAACGSESPAGGDSANPSEASSTSPTAPQDDGGSKSGDGADGAATQTADGAADGGDPPDGLVPCGAVFCREGATCVSDACELPTCTGYHVPGDYATVQAAASAVGPGGGTICVGAGTFAEDVFVSGQNPVVVQGISAAKTTVRSFSLSGSVSVKGLATTATSSISPGLDVMLSNVRLAASSGTALVVGTNGGGVVGKRIRILASQIAGASGGVRFDNAYDKNDLFSIERCDVSSPAGPAIWMNELTSSLANSPVRLSVENSWIHDSREGLLFTAPRGCTSCPYPNTPTSDAITLVNDTFTANATAVRAATERPGTPELRIHNSLFSKNTLAVSVSNGIDAQASHDLFFANTTNYEGVVDGPSTVKADPKLDGTTPPRPGPGSAAGGAADPARAPARDYWGRARGAAADIGAVEGN